MFIINFILNGEEGKPLPAEWSQTIENGLVRAQTIKFKTKKTVLTLTKKLTLKVDGFKTQNKFNFVRRPLFY